MTEVNPNTDVGAEPQIVSSANSPITFDDIESVTPVADLAEANPPVEKTEEPEPKEDTPPPQAAEAEGDKLPEGKESDELDDDKDAPGVVNEDRVEVKMMKLKAGDQEIEVQSDAIIPVKVAGQHEEVPIQDLVNNYSGKVNWDRKYNELNKEKVTFTRNKQQHDNDVASLNGMVTKMTEAMAEDPLKFYDVVAEVTKRDAVELKTAHLENQLQALDKLREMSDSDLQAWKREQILKFKEDSLDAKKVRLSQADESRQQSNHTIEVSEKYSLTEDEFRESFKVAKELAKDRPATAEDAVLVHRHNLVIDAIQDADPSILERKDIDSIVGKLRTECLENPGFTKEDVIEMVNTAFGKSEAAKVLSRKVSKTQPVQQAKPTSQQKKEIYSFEQLDED